MTRIATDLITGVLHVVVYLVLTALGAAWLLEAL